MNFWLTLVWRHSVEHIPLSCCNRLLWLGCGTNMYQRAVFLVQMRHSTHIRGIKINNRLFKITASITKKLCILLMIFIRQGLWANLFQRNQSQIWNHSLGITKSPKRHFLDMIFMSIWLTVWPNRVTSHAQKFTCPKVYEAGLCTSTSLEDILDNLWSGYDLLKKQNSCTLSASVDYGTWLNVAFELHRCENIMGNFSGTLKEWLEKNVGIQDSYAIKLSEITKLLGKYPHFRALGLSFSEVYQWRK